MLTYKNLLTKRAHSKVGLSALRRSHTYYTKLTKSLDTENVSNIALPPGLTHSLYPTYRALNTSHLKKTLLHSKQTQQEIMSLFGKKLKTILPRYQLNKFDLLKHGGSSCLSIKNVPTDINIPREGDIAERRDKKELFSECIMLGISYLMDCTLIANKDEQEGRAIHDIAPRPGMAGDSSKSKDPFYLHIENPFQKRPPHFLMLFALEGDNTSKTSYTFVKDVLSKIRDPLIFSAMKKPIFKFISGSGLDATQEYISPIISTDPSGKVRLRLYENPERMIPLTNEAEIVIHYLINVFEEIRQSNQVYGTSLQKNEMFIFNNGWGVDEPEGIMHGREGFISNDLRWILRGFLHHKENHHEA